MGRWVSKISTASPATDPSSHEIKYAICRIGSPPLPLVRITRTLTSRGERMRARGPVERDVGQRSVTHSIIWSARCSRDGGIVSPSALAVLRLITSSYLVGCSTGRSAGRAPLKILSTKAAAR